MARRKKNFHPFTLLPKELQSFIFLKLSQKDLYNLVRVNSDCYYAALPFLYRVPIFFSSSSFKSFTSPTCLTKDKASLVQELDLSSVPNRWKSISTSDFFNLSLVNWSHLRYINLCHCGSSLANSSVIGLLSSCSKALLELDLSYNGHLENMILSYIPESVAFLNLSYCSSITDDGLIPFITSHSKLTCLMLNNCSQISEDSIQALIDSYGKIKEFFHLELKMCTNMVISSSAFPKTWSVMT